MSVPCLRLSNAHPRSSFVQPGMPPLAPVAAPASAQPVPSPPPKGDDAASLAASAPGTPSLDDAAGVDGDENPYGGLSAPSEDEHAETLQAEEHPSEAKPRDSVSVPGATSPGRAQLTSRTTPASTRRTDAVGRLDADVSRCQHHRSLRGARPQRRRRQQDLDPVHLSQKPH